MKGLLIKDWKLLKNQGRFFMAIVGVMMIYSLFTDNSVFGVTYGIVMVAMFTVSTISYDEYNHGAAFLFTLPFQRRTYAIEKYVFAGTAIVLSELVFAIVGGACILFKGGVENVADAWLTVLVSNLAGGAAVFLMLLFLVPIQLKWGAEKSRMVWIGVMVVIAGIIGLMVTLKDTATFQMVVSWFRNRSAVEVIVALVVLLVAGVWISCSISVRIIEKKEF